MRTRNILEGRFAFFCIRQTKAGACFSSANSLCTTIYMRARPSSEWDLFYYFMVLDSVENARRKECSGVPRKSICALRELKARTQKVQVSVLYVRKLSAIRYGSPNAYFLSDSCKIDNDIILCKRV